MTKQEERLKKIEKLRLSVRCKRALQRAEIKSVEMLEETVVRGKLELIPGVGNGCIAEINRELKRRHGFHLPHIKLPHIKVVWK